MVQKVKRRYHCPSQTRNRTQKDSKGPKLVLGGLTKNLYQGLFFQNYDGFPVFFSCIIRCSKHFLLVERGITAVN